MTTPSTGIGAITTTTLRTMRSKLDEAAAIARAAEGCAVDGQPGRALMIALDVEPLALEANRLLQGLATLSRVAWEEQGGPAGRLESLSYAATYLPSRLAIWFRL